MKGMMLKPAAPPQTWMAAAFEVARRSPDPSTQHGAVIVHPQHGIVAEGCNEFPEQVLYLEYRLERPLKYQFIEHSERNAIYEAARHGVALAGTTMYLTGPPCADCARALIQSGISKLVYYDDPMGDHWSHTTSVAEQMMVEAGMKLTILADPMPESTEPILRAGEPWLPQF